MARPIRHRESARLHEIDGDLHRNIRNRIAIARDEFARREFSVEQLQKPNHSWSVGLGPGRNLGDLQLFHRRMRMAKYRCHVGKEIDLGPSVPHFNDCRILGSDTEQRRLRLQHFEISADRDRFRDDGAIIKNKSGHSLQRVDRRIFRRLVLHQHDIDLLGWYRDAFFSQEYARTPGVWGHFAVIEFHAVLHLPTSNFRSTSTEHGQKALSKGSNESLTRDFRSLLSLVLRNLRNAAASSL